ncbi:hypothetical protein FPQ18DRAFT_392925 [Pyronema domesticum]|nr:hypothetical protein FPQ18DRAFT_392925 [Pyronema domesticum]
MLLQQNNIEVNPKNLEGNTPLLLAIEAEHEDYVTPCAYDKLAQLLLARDDVDVNVKNNKGHTPLLLAMKNGNQKIIQTLKDRGACSADPELNIGLYVDMDVREPLHARTSPGFIL